MRLTSSVLFLSLATLVGCASDKDSDSGATTGPGTTGPGTTTPDPTVITSWGYDCAAGTTCTFSASATGDAGTLSVEVIQTGDPAFSCGPDKSVVCGVWQENYDVTGSGSYSLDLTVVTAAADQVNGSTTLFDSAEITGITFYMELADSAGVKADCAVGGHNPGYYSSLGCDTL